MRRVLSLILARGAIPKTIPTTPTSLRRLAKGAIHQNSLNPTARSLVATMLNTNRVPMTIWQIESSIQTMNFAGSQRIGACDPKLLGVADLWSASG